MHQWISKLARTFVSSSSASSAAPSPASPLVAEALEERRLCSSSLAYGINANDVSGKTYGTILKMLRDTGTHTVRMWLTINSYSARSATIFKYVKKFHADGIDITLTADAKNARGSTTQVENYFAWAAGQVGSSVDRWQIGNEVDKESPWHGNMAAYVNGMLRPAYKALHAHNEKVVSGSVSWNPADIKKLVDAGMLNYCDLVGYHPYRNTVADLRKCVAEVKALAHGKPLVATEWNVRGDNGNNGEWAEDIKDFWPVIRDNFYAAYYFAAIKNGSMAGVAAVMTSSGSHNGPFYSTYQSLKGQGGSGSVTPTPAPVVTPPAPTPVTPAPVTPTSPGDTPSSTKPTIGGFRVYDNVTGEVIDGYSSVSGTITIKLSSLKNKQLQIRAVVAGPASSVRFAFTGRSSRTENSAPFKAFGSGSKATSWTAKKGTFTLTATASSKDNGKGVVGKTKTLVLKFV